MFDCCSLRTWSTGANQFNADRAKTWRSDKRWLLRRVGRAAFGDGWTTGGGTDPQACSYPPVHTGRRDRVSDLGLFCRLGRSLRVAVGWSQPPWERVC